MGDDRSAALKLGPAALGVLLVAVVGGVVAVRAAGPAVGGLTGVALALAGALALRARPGSADAVVLDDVFSNGLMLLPGVLVVYFSFVAGGFFPDAPAFVALVLLGLLILRTTLVEHPFAGFGLGLALAAGALAAYTLWVLASSAWSDAPARALIEAVRALMYLLALVLVGSVPRSPSRLRWMLSGLVGAIFAVGVAALMTRLLPDVFPTRTVLDVSRLSYPLTYWNALGLLGSIGVILSLAVTTDRLQPAVVRIAAAAAIPVLATTVYFTFSRGGIVAGLLGVTIYVIVARPRALLSALLSAGLATAIALVNAYRADQLATDDPTTAAAVAQGHDLVVMVAVAAIGAALVRGLLLRLDARLDEIALDARLRRPVLAGACVVALVAGGLAIVQFDVADRVQRSVETFAHGRSVPGADLRARLGRANGSGRAGQWRAALDLFESHPTHGIGAGTFGLRWPRERPADSKLIADDAHSLYVETLAELGIVGFAALVVALLVILAAVVPVRRGPDRVVYAGAFAAVVAWLVHAGVDWDWEMPAVTVFVFAIGGLALARRTDAAPEGSPTRGFRLSVAILALVAAAAPALVLVSENRLDRSVHAFNRGDCGRAIDAATASMSALDTRPEPYEVLGFCQTRRGFNNLGIRALERAVERDPENWEYRYGLALVRGAGGLDPRPQASAALRLNPNDDRTRNLMQVLREPEWQQVLTEMARGERLSVVR